MARSTIVNPVKEDRIHWIHYVAILGGCMVIVFLVFFGSVPFFGGGSGASYPKKHALKIYNEEGQMLAPTTAPTVELFPIIDQDAFPVLDLVSARLDLDLWPLSFTSIARGMDIETFPVTNNKVPCAV
jgi:hypothetical protein